MDQDKNLLMKKYLQKIVDHLIGLEKYESLKSANIFFVFGSKYKTAMCDWVYGIKIQTDTPYTLRNNLIKDFQMDIRKVTDDFFNQSVCATDVIIEKGD